MEKLNNGQTQLAERVFYAREIPDDICKKTCAEWRCDEKFRRHEYFCQLLLKLIDKGLITDMGAVKGYNIIEEVEKEHPILGCPTDKNGIYKRI